MPIPYSKIRCTNGIHHLSGVIADHAETDFNEQLREVLDKITGVLASKALTTRNVRDVTVMIVKSDSGEKDKIRAEEFNRQYLHWLGFAEGEKLPTRDLSFVAGLLPGFLVEVKVNMAFKD